MDDAYSDRDHDHHDRHLEDQEGEADDDIQHPEGHEHCTDHAGCDEGSVQDAKSTVSRSSLLNVAAHEASFATGDCDEPGLVFECRPIAPEVHIA